MGGRIIFEWLLIHQLGALVRGLECPKELGLPLGRLSDENYDCFLRPRG